MSVNARVRRLLHFDGVVIRRGEGACLLQRKGSRLRETLIYITSLEILASSLTRAG